MHGLLGYRTLDPITQDRRDFSSCALGYFGRRRSDSRHVHLRGSSNAASGCS